MLLLCSDLSIMLSFGLYGMKIDYMRCKMRVSIDGELCAGVGNCVAIAPAIFKLDDENKAAVIAHGSVDDEALMEAAESCPTSAIVVEDDDGTQLYP